MRRRSVLLLSTIGFLALLGIAAPFFSRGSESACPADQLCSIVQRKHYPARHWMWSGIFPFEGGFVPDPHFMASTPLDFSDPVRKVLNAPDARFQVVNVNPGFNDRTSEIVLVVQAQGRSYQYQLGFPKREGVVAVLGTPMPPAIRAFPYRGKIALVANFFGPAKGVYLLDASLNQEHALELVSAKSPEFENIVSGLKAVANDSTTRQQFCKIDNDFASLFEKFAGSCGWTPAEYEANPGVRDYASFWLKN